MIKLKKVEIHKYKSFSSRQEFKIEDEITVLVGMNESGKTAALEAIAKANYFQDDESFKYSMTHDYPRKEKKKAGKSSENPLAITCYYEFSDKLLIDIEKEIGIGTIPSKELIVETFYDGNEKWRSFEINRNAFVSHRLKELDIYSDTLNAKLQKINNVEDLERIKEDYAEEKYTKGISSFQIYLKNQWEWEDSLNEYVARKYIYPALPKFLYYDEYFSLPSRISIEKLKNNKLEENEDKTAKALFELADINIAEITNTTNFENFIAELEATEAIISEELFKYWQTNKNLQITFQIDKVEQMDHSIGKKIVEHILDIRVKNKGVSLPLKNRSKGFNWFFSFLVWFKKIQEDESSNYVLLLDEPGLNLHASAQANLLNFLEDLSDKYQIIYTTHSPFMVDPSYLHRVRTCFETEEGTIISDSIQEKDPNTLFPLQAALGYDIAQNLFISKNNLLVEGPADLIYLTVMSGILETEGRSFLDAGITLVPVGGLDKVSTFISLLRGSKLNVVCLLDTFTDMRGRQKVEDLIRHKIIKDKNIHFFNEYTNNGKSTADVEDMFTKEEYLRLFNSAFAGEYSEIKLEDLDASEHTILKQINKVIGKDRFNHYRPANKLAQLGVTKDYFQPETLNNFEKMFTELNKLFKSQ